MAPSPTPNAFTDWTAVFSAISPILTVGAAFVAAWITWFVAHNKARTDIITAGRQNWIASLRDDLAALYEVRAALRDLEGDSQRNKEEHETTLSRMRLLRARILLRMDETQKQGRTNFQIELGETVRAFTDESQPFSYALAHKMICNGQTVLDTAWGQVKRLK